MDEQHLLGDILERAHNEYPSICPVFGVELHVFQSATYNGRGILFSKRLVYVCAFSQAHICEHFWFIWKIYCILCVIQCLHIK